MPCYCTSNTLRLFIRSVAQVDVSVSAKLAPASQLQRSSIRSFRSTGSFRGQLSTLRAFSSTISRSSNHRPDGQSTPSRPQRQGVNTWESDETGSANMGHSNVTEGAFVDFSPDAIDAIAGELRSEPIFEEDDTPAKFVSKTASTTTPRRARPGPAQRLEPTFRRTKSENTGFKLHLSAPRLPRINKDTRADSVTTSKISASRSPEKATSEEWTPPTREHWQIDKDARKVKYPDGWNPQKRLSPDAIAGIRALHAQMPEKYHTRALAESFEVSPEAISKILRTKWVPSSEEETDRQRRWFKRGESVWSRYAELGVKPPKRWRELGIGKGKPQFMKKKDPERIPIRPALVTLPRREGGLYKLGGQPESDNIEDRIL